MTAHELSPLTTELAFTSSQYFDRRIPNSIDGRSEYSVVRTANRDNTHIHVASSLTNDPESNSMGLMVVNSHSNLGHYITHLNLPEPTELDPSAPARVNAMLTFTAFKALARDERARVFAKVDVTDPEAIHQLYEDKGKPKIWEHITTADNGRVRIMGAYAHSLVGYSGIVLRNNVITEGHQIQHNLNGG